MPACTALRRLGAAGLLVAAAAIPVGAALDRVAGRDVVLVLPFPPEVVELNRATREPGDSVAGLYGTPVGGDLPGAAGPRVTRVLFPREDRVFRPEEDPTLLVMRLDKQAGDNPLQAMTVAYAARTTALVAAVGGALFLVVGTLLRRRAAR